MTNKPATYRSTLTSRKINQEYYYPFGMQMPGRSYSSNAYRYGFNGMEKDDEILGEGNNYTAEFWQYDSRLGRRWNIDPVKRHWESGYATFLGNPITFIDPSGDAPDWFIDSDGNTKYDESVKSQDDLGDDQKYLGKEGFGFEGDQYTHYGSDGKMSPARVSLGEFNVDGGVMSDHARNLSAGRQMQIYQGQSNFVNHPVTKMAAALVLSPFAAEYLAKEGIVASGEYFWPTVGIKMGIDFTGQTIANKGDISQNDYFDIALSGFTTPGFSAFAGGFIDYRPSTGLQTIGLGKSVSDVGIDMTAKYAFGSLGATVWSNTGKTLLVGSKADQLLFRVLISSPINTSGKAVTKTIKKKANGSGKSR